MTEDEGVEILGKHDVLLSSSDSGFVNAEIFTQYIERFILQTGTSLSNPSILVLDGHKSRDNVSAIENALQSGLYIVTLPAKATHLLQPLDVGIFSSFKKAYKMELARMTRSSTPDILHFVEKATRLNALFSAQDVLASEVTPNKIKKAFESTGLVPLNIDRMLSKLLLQRERSKAVSRERLEDVMTTTVIHERPPHGEETNQTTQNIKPDPWPRILGGSAEDEGGASEEGGRKGSEKSRQETETSSETSSNTSCQTFCEALCKTCGENSCETQRKEGYIRREIIGFRFRICNCLHLEIHCRSPLSHFEP